MRVPRRQLAECAPNARLTPGLTGDCAPPRNKPLHAWARPKSLICYRYGCYLNKCPGDSTQLEAAMRKQFLGVVLAALAGLFAASPPAHAQSQAFTNQTV